MTDRHGQSWRSTRRDASAVRSAPRLPVVTRFLPAPQLGRDGHTQDEGEARENGTPEARSSATASHYPPRYATEPPTDHSRQPQRPDDHLSAVGGVRARVAASLAERGFGRGDVFARYAPNLPSTRSRSPGRGGVGGEHDTANSLLELAVQIRDSGARLLVTVSELLEKAAAAAERSSGSVFGHAPHKLGDSPRHEFRVVGHGDMAEPRQLRRWRSACREPCGSRRTRVARRRGQQCVGCGGSRGALTTRVRRSAAPHPDAGRVPARLAPAPDPGQCRGPDRGRRHRTSNRRRVNGRRRRRGP